ncbi:MAG: hypothetical protein K9K75_06845 [Deltaproteobacteria bacterium]|nr:hypothetical protein [Deltaproteobacteria bacterium]
MMLLQDGSTHEWVAAKKWDLIVTMDDATNEHYSMFFTHQDRISKELTILGITTTEAANNYLLQSYMPAFNAIFIQPASQEGSTFVPWMGTSIDDI